ncbi:hypothetical protein MTBBW1_410046 [Desulfamplus magnetovallimortis]|uniref:Uncharacterized protein n=1 Tax=Desulfamplus magnetovallimortis TaxID=1246637 RepID=A0A1W1HGQ5_9BACT|nr:hypothetical protein MTBBW1_410046 [Desulfamplus magnetovallimortis]
MRQKQLNQIKKDALKSKLKCVVSKDRTEIRQSHMSHCLHIHKVR